MGFRTVVILNNDLSSTWMEDPQLGKKIFHSAAEQFSLGQRERFQYGTIAEQVHCDVQTLAVVDSLGFTPLAHTSWYQNQKPEERNLQLLLAAADKLGYRLVRKSK